MAPLRRALQTHLRALHTFFGGGIQQAGEHTILSTLLKLGVGGALIHGLLALFRRHLLEGLTPLARFVGFCAFFGSQRLQQ